jgi:hypothetical protein
MKTYVNSQNKRDFGYIMFPYCIKKLDDGTYIVLNRMYKPIGFKTKEYLRYEDYPACHKIRGINKKTAKLISWDGNDDTNMIFLYYDGNIPTDSDKNMDA